MSVVKLKTGGQTLAVTLATTADGTDATVDDAVHRLAGVTATHVASIAGATVEALDQSGTLSPVQQAFIDSGAFQCGFCTPGFVLMTHQLLERNPDPSEDDIRHYLSGNLCRCAAYPEIVEAVRAAARAIKQSR